jgi:hypothetical protein
MNSKFKFSIQTLLSEKDGKVSAPMSPMLFAEEMQKRTGLQFNRLARVWFDDETINQIAEDNGYTGHDTLIIGHEVSNDLMLSLWVDIGIGGVPIAMCFLSDKEILMTKVYGDEPYERKLTDPEIREIFENIFSNPGQLAIIEKKELLKS